MTEADARARLERNVTPALEPPLTVADLDALMLDARRIDDAGLEPGDAGYVPTWTRDSIDAASSEGWLIRGGRCADDMDFGEDGQRFNQSQRHKHCMDMHRFYRRSTGSVTLGSVTTA